MIIALDFDNTYDRDPLFWDQVIMAAERHGHTVLVVTMRHEHERPDIPLWPNMPIFCTGREKKVGYMEAVGIDVDVWIDDDPLALVDGF